MALVDIDIQNVINKMYLVEKNNFQITNDFFTKSVDTFLKVKYGDDISYKFIMTIPIFHQNWEMDSLAALIELSNNKKILIHTDHNSIIEVDDPKLFLADEIKKMEAACSIQRKAASLFN